MTDKLKQFLEERKQYVSLAERRILEAYDEWLLPRRAPNVTLHTVWAGDWRCSAVAYKPGDLVYATSHGEAAKSDNDDISFPAIGSGESSSGEKFSGGGGKFGGGGASGSW